MATLVFVALARGSQEAGYTARFPDLPEADASGGDMADLLVAARDAAQRELQRLTDAGLEWPVPRPIEAVAIDPGAIAFLVDLTVEDTAVRVNISIGERLLKRIDQAAEAAGMSRSAYIAAAARAALGDKSARSGAQLDAIARTLQDEWSSLSAKLAESLGPNSSLNRNLADWDNRVSEMIRKSADSISAAMARRTEAAQAPPPQNTAQPPN